MTTITSEYQKYSVAELEQILKDPVNFAQPFNAFTRDVTNIDINVADVTEQVAANTTQIAINVGDIATNVSDIANNTATITAHIGSNSQHGVTGDNVGTLDFAQILAGGVVLLAVAVADAVPSNVSVTSPDASAAPVAYDQAQIQGIVDLVNELKADVNQLVLDFNSSITQINALLTSMRDANQLDT